MLQLFKNFSILLGLTMLSVSTYADNGKNDIRKTPPRFDIRAFEKMKANNGGKSAIEIIRPDGTYVSYREDDDTFSERISNKRIHSNMRIYYKPSGIIKQEFTQFHGVTVGKISNYNEQGGLLEERVITSDDWMEKLIRLAKAQFNADLWNSRSGLVYQGRYQGEDIILLFHQDGKELKLSPGGIPPCNFAFIRRSDLKILARGYRDQIATEWGRAYGLTMPKYITDDGKEIFLDK